MVRRKVKGLEDLNLFWAILTVKATENKLNPYSPKKPPEIKSIKAPPKKASPKEKLPLLKKLIKNIKIKTSHWPKKKTPIEGSVIWLKITSKKTARMITTL